MFMIHLHAVLSPVFPYSSSSNGKLNNIHRAAAMLFYIPKMLHQQSLPIFGRGTITTQFYGRTVNSASVSPSCEEKSVFAKHFGW
jgi:hypothetical protein